MATINQTVRRFENGGILTIKEVGAGSADTIANIEAGTLKFTPGLEEPMPYSDRGTLNTSPLAGDERPTKVSIDVKFAKTLSVSGELYKRLTAAAASGLVPKFEVVASFPDYKGAATGEKITFAHCIVDADGIQYQSGDRFDRLSLSLTDLEPRPACASY